MVTQGQQAKATGTVTEFADAQGKAYVFEKIVNGGSATTTTAVAGVQLSTDRFPLRSILITNTSNATIYIGSDSVNSQNGAPLAAGLSMTIAPTDTQNRVRFCDVFVSGGGTGSLGYSWVGQA